MTDLWIRPSGAALGADIHGVDLSRPVSDAQFAEIAEAWKDYLVLRFSGQRIDDHQLMAFSARFGELDRVPIAAAHAERVDAGLAPDVAPWVTVISSIVQDGRPIGGLGASELVWHTDMSYNPLPPRASLLYAIEVPPSGGDTGFLDMYAAYETLPAELRKAIDGRTCIHDSSHNSAGELRKGFQETIDVSRAPGAVHPLVRLHPRERSQGAVPRAAAERLHPWPAGRRERGPARCPVGPRHAGPLRLDAEVAGRRSRDVGQPLRHASPRRLRTGPAAAHASHADRRRAGAGRLEHDGFSWNQLNPSCLLQHAPFPL